MIPATPIRLLLVEDDDLLRRGLERFLTLSGYAVTAAGDSLSFYREIDDQVFDVALIDLGLPDQRGDLDLPELAAQPLLHQPAQAVLVERAQHIAQQPGRAVLSRAKARSRMSCPFW